MVDNSIPLCRICIGDDEIAAVTRVLRSGWLVQGEEVKKFENWFEQQFAPARAVATSSCTTALHACLLSLNLKPGEEVIVPAFSWAATAHVVELCGAKPVFCDISLATYNIDVDQLEQHLTGRTVGIIPVHLFGLHAQLEPIKEFALKQNLWVVEDAACALGASDGAAPVTFSSAACFSFHPRKSITTAEGGMILTKDQRIANFVGAFRNHGLLTQNERGDQIMSLSESCYYSGLNYRMSDVHAAIGNSQLAKLDYILKERRRVALSYNQLLSNIPQLVLPCEPPGLVHAYQSYVCRLASDASRGAVATLREDVVRRLGELAIEVRQGTMCLPTLPYYRKKYGCSEEQCPAAYLAEQSTLSLPIYPEITAQQQERVAMALRSIFALL